MNSNLNESLSRELEFRNDIIDNLKSSNEFANDLTNIISIRINDLDGSSKIQEELIDALTTFAGKLKQPGQVPELIETIVKTRLMAAANLLLIGKLALAEDQIKLTSELLTNYENQFENHELYRKRVSQIKGRLLASRRDKASTTVFESGLESLDFPENLTHKLKQGRLNSALELGHELTRKGSFAKSKNILKLAESKSRDIVDQLATTDSVGLHCQILSALGTLHRTMGESKQAIVYFTHAKNNLEQVLRIKPKSRRIRASLAGTYLNISTLVARDKDLPLRKKCHDMFRDIVADNPDMPVYRKNLIQASNNYVLRLVDVKDFSTAAEILSDDLIVANELTNEFPDSVEYQIATFQLLNAQTYLLNSQQDYVHALEINQDILDRIDNVIKAVDDDIELRKTQVTMLMNLAVTHNALNQPKQAAIAIKKAKTISAPLSLPQWKLEKIDQIAEQINLDEGTNLKR